MITHFDRWAAVLSADGAIVTFDGWMAYGPFVEFAHAVEWAEGMAEEDPEGAALPAGCVAQAKRGGDAS